MAKEIIGGMDSLMAKLDALGGNVMEALAESVRVTTLAAQGSAKRWVPVKTGNLKDHIWVRWENGKAKFTGVVYNNVEYAVHVEMGTYDGGGEGKGMAPRPYMTPALNEHRYTFSAEAKVRLHIAINSIVRGG